MEKNVAKTPNVYEPYFVRYQQKLLSLVIEVTAQNVKFFFKDLLSKCALVHLFFQNSYLRNPLW